MNKSSIGIDLGGTKMLVVGEKAGTLVSRKYPTGKDIDFSDILNNFQSFITEFKISPLSICVAIPGLVNGESVVDCDVLPCLKGVSASQFSLVYPVKFINDVEGALIEEKKNYAGVKNLVVIMIGTGIGMSMIIDGKECQGASGFTGELGYISVMTDNGPTFLDNVSAGAGLLTQFGDSFENFKLSIDRGEDRAVSLIKKGALYMGLGISSVISLINPEAIIIGGGTSTYKGYFDLMIESVNEFTLPILRESTIINSCTSPGFTVVYGALSKAKEIINNN